MNKDFQFDCDMKDDDWQMSAAGGAPRVADGRSSPWWGRKEAAIQQWQAQKQAPLGPASPELMPPPPTPAKKARTTVGHRSGGGGGGEGGAGDGLPAPRVDQPDRRAPVGDREAGDSGKDGDVNDAEPAAQEMQALMPQQEHALAYEGMVERYVAAVAELTEWRERNQQMQRDLEEATAEHDALVAHSRRLDDEIAEEQAKLERTRKREKEVAEELKKKQESVKAKLAEKMRREKEYERDVNSYCKALMEIVQEARDAPLVFAPENLQRIIQEEKTKQTEIKGRIAVLDKELHDSKKEFAKMVDGRNDLSVCTENNMSRILQRIIDELEEDTAKNDEETEMIREEIREVEAENAFLEAQLQMLRDNPQLMVQARAAAIAAAAAASTSAASQHYYYSHTTLQGREQGDDDE